MTAAYEPSLPAPDASLWVKCKWWGLRLGLIGLGFLLGMGAA
jgi:hypothetical protein